MRPRTWTVRTRCKACQETNPAGFTFCLACGTRQEPRFWPAGPVPLLTRAARPVCPFCFVHLASIEYGDLESTPGPADADSDASPGDGPAPSPPRPYPSHECARCARQFWRIGSRWEGYWVWAHWRAVAISGALADWMAGLRAGPSR